MSSVCHHNFSTASFNLAKQIAGQRRLRPIQRERKVEPQGERNSDDDDLGGTAMVKHLQQCSMDCRHREILTAEIAVDLPHRPSGRVATTMPELLSHWMRISRTRCRFSQRVVP